MRPIEFKVWHKPSQRMHHVHSLLLAQGVIFTLPVADSDKISQVLKVEDCELMQYTGVLDENGDKIWEGDVLAHRYEDEDEERTVIDMEHHIEVKYINGSFYMQDEPLSTDNSVASGGNYTMPVIGNKWQHPFLLENATVEL